MRLNEMTEAKSPSHVNFHYQKSGQYRVVHADGAWGGLTPKLGVFLAFFSERPPIPTLITHSVTSKGELGPEIAQEVKEGLLREVEVGVILDEAVARSLVSWLQDRLNDIGQIRSKNTSADVSSSNTTLG